MADRTAKGREFFSQVAQHLPDDLRAGFESFLASGDQAAQQVLATIGDGTLRQDTFSREMDGLRRTKAELEAWHAQLAQWAQDNANAPAPVDPLAGNGHGHGNGAPGGNGAGTPPASFSRDDAQALVAAEFGRREVYFAKYVADATKLATQHFHQFGEVLDINQILAHPKLGEVGLQGAYEALHKEKIDQRAADLKAKDRKALEDEIRNELLAKMGTGAGSVPYPIGEGSPLDHLGKTDEDYSPEAAAAMYRQLVNGRPVS